ncbi:preprotein translocase subunit SecE [Candidatus Kaiserbacteria bacterium]|nr:MAG: preprotein translocase subunit SecE [Candidatus Kaiserbacteria bacterium]
MRLIQYIKDTHAEMKHVSWPTQKQTMIFTILVILLSIVVALYLGAFDYVFSGLLNQII